MVKLGNFPNWAPGCGGMAILAGHIERRAVRTPGRFPLRHIGRSGSGVRNLRTKKDKPAQCRHEPGTDPHGAPSTSPWTADPFTFCYGNLVPVSFRLRSETTGHKNSSGPSAQLPNRSVTRAGNDEPHKKLLARGFLAFSSCHQELGLASGPGSVL